MCVDLKLTKLQNDLVKEQDLVTPLFRDSKVAVIDILITLKLICDLQQNWLFTRRKVISYLALCLCTLLGNSLLSELSVGVTFTHKHTDRAFLLLIGRSRMPRVFKLEASLSSFYQKLERLEKPVHLWAASNHISLNAFFSDFSTNILLREQAELLTKGEGFHTKPSFM